MAQKLSAWLDTRLGRAPRTSDRGDSPACSGKKNLVYGFGALTFVVLLVQALSGIYLAMYFQPGPAEAWKSIEFIEASVDLGFFTRSLHRWGAFVTMVFLVFHIVQVLFRGAYRAPRELSWLAGLVLLLLTIGFIISGYLLPWDFRAYWTVQTITNWLQDLPLFSSVLHWLFYSDSSGGIVPVGRWFSIHIFVLPLCTGLIFAGHYILFRRHGPAGAGQ